MDYNAPMSESSPERRWTVGCVKFLNAQPLIAGLEVDDGVTLRPEVPSALLDALAAGVTDIALCPVIDYQRSAEPLAIVPSGGIGCDGPTLTVRLISRVPLGRITEVHADTDSHTSAALARVILHDAYGLTPAVRDLPCEVLDKAGAALPDTMLLIGDKVVTHHPDPVTFTHVLDLGEAWKRLTGLPFVFAVWMARPEAALGDLPRRLDAGRQRNVHRIDDIVARHAEPLGWPVDLARQYLSQRLVFEIGPRQFEAIEQFWQRAAALGLIDSVRPLRIHPDAVGSAVS